MALLRPEQLKLPAAVYLFMLTSCLLAHKTTLASTKFEDFITGKNMHFASL